MTSDAPDLSLLAQMATKEIAKKRKQIEPPRLFGFNSAISVKKYTPVAIVDTSIAKSNHIAKLESDLFCCYCRCKLMGNECNLTRCGFCHSVIYCSREHQKAHWLSIHIDNCLNFKPGPP